MWLMVMIVALMYVCMYSMVVMETMFKQGSSYCSHGYRVHAVNRMGLSVRHCSGIP